MKKTFTREEAKEIGDKLGIDWSVISLDEYVMGVNVELEHGSQDARTNVTNDDPITTGKIAWAHLNEIPTYYSKLKVMEGD